MLFDPRTDHEVFDDNVTVTVTSSDNAVAVYGVTATIGRLSTRELMLNGPAGILPTDQVMVLYADALEGLVPGVGYVVAESGGDTWTIVSVTCDKYGGLPVSYRAITRKRL